MIDLKLLIKNGVQFGHQAWRWCPRMAKYIWGKKNGVHLIDVSKTAFELDRAAEFLKAVAADGGQILWVGTKKPAQKVMLEVAQKLQEPYVVHRWIGGTLTNYSQVKKSVTKLLHYEDILSKADQYSYTKKEFGVFQKMVDRLLNNVGGIRELSWPVGAVVVVDAHKEAVAIKEAQAMGVPVVALVDTNADPTGIEFVIPGNDDVARSIRVIIHELASAVEEGKKEAEKREEVSAKKAALAAEAAAKDAPEVLPEDDEDEEDDDATHSKREARKLAKEKAAKSAPKKSEDKDLEKKTEKKKTIKKESIKDKIED